MLSGAAAGTVSSEREADGPALRPLAHLRLRPSSFPKVAQKRGPPLRTGHPAQLVALDRLAAMSTRSIMPDPINQMIQTAEANLISTTPGAVPPHLDDGGHLGVAAEPQLQELVDIAFGCVATAIGVGVTRERAELGVGVVVCRREGRGVGTVRRVTGPGGS